MPQPSYRSHSLRRRLLQALVGTPRGVLEAKTARSVCDRTYAEDAFLRALASALHYVRGCCQVVADVGEYNEA
jgi:hypothetical protein